MGTCHKYLCQSSPFLIWFDWYHSFVATQPRFQPISDREVKVGLRLNYARRYEKRYLATFAEMVGLTKDQLANIECGRVALKFDAGIRCCKVLDVHPSWLNLGRVSGPYPAWNARFVKVVSDRLKARGSATFADVWTEVSWQFPVKVVEDSACNNIAGKATCVHVRTWKQLRDRLIAATAPRGQKQALANWLGVSLANVSRWLSGREPGGNYALRMLLWVETVGAKPPGPLTPMKHERKQRP